ncbi:DUF4179 domain-containing protein [Sutcliffiella halmapala]|uniref:DUF4179 domain-containing protein n=1 Tax=Sutcliffiella halmapala TaxID=79882 RepID=UPI000994B23D|nr:DUF4179 domain-containing protein [Sutcliffiella halmapala]
MDDKKIQIPESIDQYIQQGIHKGKRIKKIKKRSIVSILSSIALIFLFITSVRVSPAFANTVKTLPGMEAIVDMIQGDQGLEDALSNDFIHEVHVEETLEGITFSVDQIIVDQARMIIFYSLKTTGKQKYLRLTNLNLLNHNDNQIKAVIEYSDPNENVNLQEVDKMNGKIVVTFGDDEEVPEKLILQTQLELNDSETASYDEGRLLDSKWNLEIPIKKEWYEKTREIINIDETVEIKNQKFYVEKVVIDPTLIALDIKFSAENEMQRLKASR